RFADGLGELAGEEGAILLEVGPGRTLQSLARQHPATACHTLLGSLPEARDRRSGRAFLLKTLGRLWLTGQPVDWRAVHAPESRRRVELHTYPFERKRYRLAAAAGIPARQDPAPPPQAGAEPAAPPPATAAGSRERRVETPYVAPCDEREKDLVAVWQEMLGIEPIGVHDDFFELGGGSLQAARCLSRIRHAGGSELTMQQFAEAATVARLSRLLCPEAPDRAARAVPSPEGDLEEWEI
ncbi:MAG: polyketide synthase, partial [bacterium]|nr:polyketide synthase [bacterium]